MFNQFGIEGHYQDDGNGIFWVGPIENEILFAKLAKKHEIKTRFEDELISAGVFTTTEGWVVNARRQDLDNLKNLHEFLTLQGASTVSVRMADNTMVEMSLSRLGQLCVELQGLGLSLYQKKWQKIAEVDTAVTVAEVNAVIW